MTLTLRTEDWDVRHRLADFDLDAQALRDCVRRGFIARSGCTLNHPVVFASLTQWAETVRALRELMVLKGWSRLDANHYPRAIDPTGQIAIAVATGDENTGIATKTPTTKTAKGPSTIAAVTTNSAQVEMSGPGFDLPADAVVPPLGERARTWILLMHLAPTEIRAELSLATSIGEDGYIDGWAERIILPPAPLDPVTVDVAAPSGPEIDIQIKRRA